MRPIHMVLYGLMGAMAAVIFLQPFTAMGDRIGPGYAGLLNGGVAMGLLLVIGVIALFSKRLGVK